MGDVDELTFRKWNPGKIDTTMGSDNSSSTDPMCPLICIGWYIVERICFQRVFDDCIDYCCWGYMSFQDVLEDYRQSTNINGRTILHRLLAFMLNTLSLYLMFTAR